MNSSITDLRNEFIAEAMAAPRLFKDLAKLESYIAESYRTRSLIELIQNADDAGASMFGIHQLNNSSFIVGNNGRSFTKEDVESLCRSGASTKQRDGVTIGYRGVGFKSVVNLAETIGILSGDKNFCFNRLLTQEATRCDSNVPLVRIPHPLEDGISIDLQLEIDQIRKVNGYTTIFLFDSVRERIAHEELTMFDSDSLLFIQHLTSVSIQIDEMSRHIGLDVISKHDGFKKTMIIDDGESKSEWQVYTSEANSIVKAAFQSDNSHIIPAEQKKSVFHSFLPTEDYVGAFLKVNGDFSTEPSRKRIDMDETSVASFNLAADLICELMIISLEEDIVMPGIFTPFINSRTTFSPGRPNLLRAIEKCLPLKQVELIQGHPIQISELRIRPEWLNSIDYCLICTQNNSYLPDHIVSLYPELPAFLGEINIPRLRLTEALERLNDVSISVLGLAQIFSRISKEYQYKLEFLKDSLFSSLRLFPVNGDRKVAGDISRLSSVDTEFLKLLKDLADPDGLRMTLKYLNIENDTDSGFQLVPASSIQIQQKGESGTLVGSKAEVPILEPGMAKIPGIQRWRSAEQNAEEYIRSIEGVSNVQDVTRANLGYDLEVTLTSGRRLFVEVKSVRSLTEAIRLTNNEYTAAHQYGELYFIAIVMNDIPFQIFFVQNPLEMLSLHKQCERWSWVCENYQNALMSLQGNFQRNI